MHLKIGTRSSSLALEQTRIFCEKLSEKLKFTFEIIKIKTTGDKISDIPLYEIGGKALFLKELEDALLKNEIDIAIHSLKDVPGVLDNRFKIAAYLEREEANDAFISHKYQSIDELPPNSIIGSSSPRRICFIRKLRPDLKISILRGNINTRLSKLSKGEYDAIILAEVGLRRLKLWNDDYCKVISENQMIPAVGQGVITAEILSNRKDLEEILSEANDFETSMFVSVEREYLKELNADCKTPVASYVRKKENIITASFMLATEDCKKLITEELIITAKNIENLGKTYANKMQQSLK